MTVEYEEDVIGGEIAEDFTPEEIAAGRDKLMEAHMSQYELELKTFVQAAKIRELEARLKPKNKSYPHVQVQVKGTMNMLMQMAEEGFKKQHPDMECRFVYAPEKSDRALANFAKYRARGYRPVMVSECTFETPELFGGASDRVRIGDDVMMAIERDKKIARFQELTRSAVRQATVSEEAQKADVNAQVKKGSKHAKGAGKLKQTSQEYEVGVKKED